MSESNMPSNIVDLAFRKVAVAFAGRGRGRGLGQGRGAGRNKKSSDKTNRLIDAVLAGGKTAIDALSGDTSIVRFNENEIYNRKTRETRDHRRSKQKRRRDNSPT